MYCIHHALIRAPRKAKTQPPEQAVTFTDRRCSRNPRSRLGTGSSHRPEPLVHSQHLALVFSCALPCWAHGFLVRPRETAFADRGGHDKADDDSPSAADAREPARGWSHPHSTGHSNTLPRLLSRWAHPFQWCGRCREGATQSALRTARATNCPGGSTAHCASVRERGSPLGVCTCRRI
jgi:hypothetical protein